MRRILIAAIPLLLAGCTAPDIPEDALVDTYDGLDGATMWAWLDTSNPNFTVIHGYFEYQGDDLLHTSQKDPRGAWNLTIEDEAGRSIIFDERPSRKAYYKAESYSHKEAFQFTWLHDEYERYEQPATDEYLESAPVPPGNYTITLQFGVAYIPEDAFEGVLELQI